MCDGSNTIEVYFLLTMIPKEAFFLSWHSPINDNLEIQIPPILWLHLQHVKFQDCQAYLYQTTKGEKAWSITRGEFYKRAQPTREAYHLRITSIHIPSPKTQSCGHV